MSKMNRNNKSRSNTPLWATGGGVVVLAVVVALGATGGWFSGDEPSKNIVTTVKAARQPMVIGVSQPGQLEAANKEIVRCIPRGKHEIKWIIDEGTEVKPGDVIVRLDTSTREERLLEQQLRVETAESEEVTSRVNYENMISQSQSNVEKAELALEFAELALKKFLEGEYPQDLKSAQANVEISRENYKRAADKAEWSKKLATKGYITDSEAEADVASARKAKLDMEVAEGKLDLLQNFTYGQTKRKLESDVVQNRAELDRVRKKAQADVYRSEIAWKTKKSQLELDSRELERDKDDLKNCIIRAPVAGRVVYAPQGHRWRSAEPVAAGVEVTQDQELIHIPEFGAMNVAIKIDETQRDKVEQGLRVRITGPNLPPKGLTGTLDHIAEYLDPSGWWNNNMKVYSATVTINEGEPLEGLRTGMNCQTEIIVAEYDDVLTVPLQCVTMVDEQHVVYVKNGSGEPKRVPVEIGLDNGRMVHVLDGIGPGTEVVLEPPLAPATRKMKPADREKRGKGKGDGDRPKKRDAPALSVSPSPARTDG
jgi:HlyD family secretion protein